MSNGNKSGLAIASLVLGIVGYASCGITAIPAVICGHLALKRMASPDEGKVMAIIGLALGYSAIAAGVIYLILALVFGATLFSRIKSDMKSMQPAPSETMVEPAPEEDRFDAIRVETSKIIAKGKEQDGEEIELVADDATQSPPKPLTFDLKRGIVKKKFIDSENIDKNERSITTTSGEVYKGVILNVGPKGIDIAHANGVTLINFGDLTLTVKEEFYDGSK